LAGMASVLPNLDGDHEGHLAELKETMEGLMERITSITRTDEMGESILGNISTDFRGKYEEAIADSDEIDDDMLVREFHAGAHFAWTFLKRLFKRELEDLRTKINRTVSEELMEELKVKTQRFQLTSMRRATQARQEGFRSAQSSSVRQGEAEQRKLRQMWERETAEVSERQRKEIEELKAQRAAAQEEMGLAKSKLKAFNGIIAEQEAELERAKQQKLQQIMKKWKHAQLWTAYSTWRKQFQDIKMARAEERSNRILQKMLNRMKRAELYRAWVMFTETVKEQKVIRHKLDMVVRRIKNQAILGAWARWKEMWEEARELRRKLAAAVKRMKNRSLSMAWNHLREQCEESARLKRVMKRIVARMAKGGMIRCFDAWASVLVKDGDGQKVFDNPEVELENLREEMTRVDLSFDKECIKCYNYAINTMQELPGFVEMQQAKTPRPGFPKTSSGSAGDAEAQTPRESLSLREQARMGMEDDAADIQSRVDRAVEAEVVEREAEEAAQREADGEEVETPKKDQPSSLMSLRRQLKEEVFNARARIAELPNGLVPGDLDACQLAGAYHRTWKVLREEISRLRQLVEQHKKGNMSMRMEMLSMRENMQRYDKYMKADNARQKMYANAESAKKAEEAKSVAKMRKMSLEEGRHADYSRTPGNAPTAEKPRVVPTAGQQGGGWIMEVDQSPAPTVPDFMARTPNARITPGAVRVGRGSVANRLPGL